MKFQKSVDNNEVSENTSRENESRDNAIVKDLAVYAGLFGFGMFYNKLVSTVNRKHGQHGYTAFLVAFGVTTTVAALSTRIGPVNTLRLAAGFVASGLPMVLGDTNRHLQYRQEVTDALERARRARQGNYVGQSTTRERQRPQVH